MKLAVFDFDGTLLTKDTLPCLGREWLRQGRSKARYTTTSLSIWPVVFLYKARLFPRETMKGIAFRKFNRLYTNMTRHEIEEFFLKAYPYVKKEFSPAVLEEIKSAQEQGFHCVLLSGSYTELLQIIAKDLGIDTVIGAELAYKNDKFDHKGKTPFIDGRTKLALLKEAFANKKVDWETSIAFGDSYADICILETVGERVAVNPDVELIKHAQAKNWRIISF